MTNTRLATINPSSRQKRGFYWRSFLSLFLVSSMLILSLTGIALYVAPSGRVAETTVWRFLWLNKTNWEAMHTVFSFLWIPVAVAHTWLNWRPIMAYLRDRGRKAITMKRELALTLLLSAFFGVASVTNWPPVAQVMAFGEWFTGYWETQGRAEGYYVPTQTETHTIAAPNLSETPTPATNPTGSSTAPAGAATVITGQRGLGRFTVAEIAADTGISADTALQRLTQYGITAKTNEKLLALSGRSGLSPLELDSIIRGTALEPTQTTEPNLK